MKGKNAQARQNEMLLAEIARLKRSVSELTVLNDLAVAANRLQDVKDMLDLVVKKSIQAVKAEQGAILLVTEQEGGPLKTLVRQANRSSQLLTYKAGTSITGWVLHHRKPLIIEDFSTDTRFKASQEEAKSIRSVLCVPIRFQSQFLGVLLATNKQEEEKRFDSDDLRLFTILAAQSGQLIYNLQLQIAQQQALDLERERISRDMHDEVGAGLTRIAILSEITKTHLANNPLAKNEVESIARTAGEVIDSISAIVWALKPQNDTLDNLAAYLRHYISEYLELTNTNSKFDFPTEIPEIKISSEVRRNVFLIIKEAVQNIVKHAGATEAFFSLKVTENYFEIQVRDNGAGFDTNLSKHGNGLTNMANRAKLLEGGFKLTSAPGSGTHIFLKRYFSLE